MTQEELDALVDSADDVNIDEVGKADSSSNPAWPPPAPSSEHKVVHQLDEVTKDSEEKAIELMDRLDAMNKFFSQSELSLKNITQSLEKNVELFTILSEKFPHVMSFKDALDNNQTSKNLSEEVTGFLQQGQDEVFVAMDTMQYQDIHRQKIERAINVMRALNRYMSSLFEGKIDDDKRVSSAVHIPGDTTSDLVDEDDIEDLIASLRQKK
ncbi:chemotaxis protein [Campylobacter troglodytis]|uniref:chemotaxis protein n=1 Tax=Campylobacter troglodytis TaxID=654363 RepID=UPI00115BA4DC|nr:chemotaxis protein [Campylobacter troglodytis]TQR57722.1 chemotaxis protein [Campylobacter troglodytis]